MMHVSTRILEELSVMYNICYKGQSPILHYLACFIFYLESLK